MQDLLKHNQLGTENGRLRYANFPGSQIDSQSKKPSGRSGPQTWMLSLLAGLSCVLAVLSTKSPST